VPRRRRQAFDAARTARKAPENGTIQDLTAWACPSGDSAEIPPKVEIRRKTLRSVEWQNSRSA
jgi:hypothetical protein